MLAAAVRAIAALVLAVCTQPSHAETLRIAAFNAELTRRDPGLLVRDLQKGDDPQIAQVAEIIRQVRPDVLLLTGIDYDAQAMALSLFRDQLNSGPDAVDYPALFAAPVNAGIPSAMDLDGDGRLATADDAWGFGYFPGQGGMAVLSRFPVDHEASRTFQNFRWAELPGALLPVWPDGTPFPNAAVQGQMRLSSLSHWDVVVQAPGGAVHLLASHPSPPVFDGPEDANGCRNHDETAFWLKYLEGVAFVDDQGREAPLANGQFVILGDFNADPVDGDGLRDAIIGLLNSGKLFDPEPVSEGAKLAGLAQSGANAGQSGDPARDTADWPDEAGKPGNMRVDFVLPSSGFTVLESGVFWPEPDDPLASLVEPAGERAVRHRLVWVDVSR